MKNGQSSEDRDLEITLHYTKLVFLTISDHFLFNIAKSVFFLFAINKMLALFVFFTTLRKLILRYLLIINS